MCGRFIRTSPLDAIRTELGIEQTSIERLEPRFNVCPGEPIVAAIERDGKRRLGWLHWGLGPESGVGRTSDSGRAPGAAHVRTRPLINARAETVASRPAFRDAFRRRRCLVVADGFYEWKSAGARKTPWLIRSRSGRLLTFAGVWQPRAHRGDDRKLYECAIVTCPPNDLLAPIHDRMPVILPPGARDRWLNEASAPEDLGSLLVPAREGTLEAFAVSTDVNSPRNDFPSLIEPVTAPTPSAGDPRGPASPERLPPDGCRGRPGG